MNSEEQARSLFMHNSFPVEIMKELFKGCQEIKLKKNSVIYACGEEVKNIYWLSEGVVEVFVGNDKGMKQIIAYHYPDSIIGEINAFSEDLAFQTCITIKPSIIHKCPVDLFYDRIQDKGLVREYIKMLTRKTQANCMQLSAMALEDCASRINLYYNNELTHQQLSELIGCTRVQVTRLMNKKK